MNMILAVAKNRLLNLRRDRAAFVLAIVLLAGCAKRDVDECRRGDRSRCPGDASHARPHRG